MMCLADVMCRMSADGNEVFSGCAGGMSADGNEVFSGSGIYDEC